MRDVVCSWVLVCGLVSACASSPPKDDSATATAEPTEAEKAALAMLGGLGAPGNDAEVVALAREVVQCEWRGEKGPVSECAAYDAWRDSELFEQDRDATLVAMLGDADAKARWVGVDGLLGNGERFRTDAALAGAVVFAASRERDPDVAPGLGAVVSRIKANEAGVNAPVQQLITSHPLAPMRKAAVGTYMFNSRSPENFDFVVGVIRKEQDPATRLAAVRSFWVGTPPERHEQVCALWLELASDADAEVAGFSASHVAGFPRSGGCPDQRDPLLDLLEANAAAGKVSTGPMATALSQLYRIRGASDAQRARAQAIARTLVAETSNAPDARGNALKFLGESDPGAKEFAARFVDDEASPVKSFAKRIVDGKITPK